VEGSTDVRERDLDRLLTFVDAIVAIAITLLVLPLVELASDLGERTVREVVVEHQGQFWSFLLSFAVIARLWWAQHEVVRPLLGMPPRLYGALMTWAVTIVFLPFPTALVAEAPDDVLTKLLYLGTITAAMATMVLVHLLVGRHPETTGGADLRGVRRSGAGVTVVNVGLLLVALALTLLVPALSYAPLLLLVVDRPVARLLDLDRPRRA